MAVADRKSKPSRVQRHYDAYPYPLRRPEDERTRIHITSLDDLGSLNHYCFNGRKNFQSGFRALVAGGGTGDAIVHLAEQLRHADAQLVYLDFSPAALDIARQRIEVRGLAERVEWIEGSLLDLPHMDLPKFDYINCSGVLHHLEDPQAGLQALTSVLTHDGAVGLMLYGHYGRTGIHHLQQLTRMLGGDDELPERLQSARALLDALPATNWGKRSLDLFPIDGTLDDNELCDLLLNPQDKSFDVAGVYRLLDGAGLHLAEFTLDQRALYEPQFAFRNEALLRQLRRLTPREQLIATELYWGAIANHTFWATRTPDPIADPCDPDNVPFFSRWGRMLKVQEEILNTTGETWSHQFRLQGQIDVMLTFQVVPAARRFIQLIDDRRTMGEIVAMILSAYNPAPLAEEAWKVCRYVFDVLTRQDLLLVRHKSTASVFG